MGTKSKSCNHYTRLNVRFNDDSSCSTNSDQRLLNLFFMLNFAVKCGFLRQCRPPVVSSGQNGHRVRLLWNDYAFE